MTLLPETAIRKVANRLTPECADRPAKVVVGQILAAMADRKANGKAHDAECNDRAARTMW